jgi:hypothetical protein
MATKFFWAKAEKHTIGNFRPEVRATNGVIMTPEQAIKFQGGVYATEDPEIAAFIRESLTFGIDCFEVDTMEEARKQHEARRATRLITTETSSTDDVRRITTDREAQAEASTGGRV